MKRPFSQRRSRPSTKEHSSPIEAMSLTHQLMLANTQVVQRRLAKLQWNIRLFSFFAGMLLVAAIMPASPIRQALGYGGGSAFVNATCGQPTYVFSTLLKGEKYTLPSKTQLMQLPTPKQRPIATASDVNYDPAANRLCAGGWVALDTRFVHPGPTVQGSTNYNPNYGGNLVTGALTNLWTSFQQWVRDSLQNIFDAFVSFGLMITTPKAVTYGHPVVQNLNAWMLLLTNSAIVLFLVVGGYKYMFGDYKSFREFVPKLIVAAIVANFSLPVLGQFIELCNTVSDGILGIVGLAGIGNLNLPWGAINWVTAPEYLIIVYLIEFLGAVLLSGQMLFRIVFLCLLLVTAPVGLFLCFGAGTVFPGARPWGTLWAQAFVATLIAQPLQLICLGLGAALTASFGHSSITPVSILIGIAALFLAGKIPDILLSSIMRVRVLGQGTADEFGQNVVGAAQTGAEMMALFAA